MSRRGLLIALIVSLAVNLFVLGGLAGAVIMGVFNPPPPHMAGPPRLAAAGASLSPQHRDGWRATLGQTAQTVTPKLQQAHALRRQAWKGLTMEPVNPQASLADLDQARTLEFQARAEMDRAVVGFAATLPLDERRNLAAALSRPPAFGMHHGWSGGPGPGERPPALPDR